MNNDKVNTNLFSDIAHLIDEAKRNSARVINTTITNLYWNIGKTIKKELMKDNRAEYGAQLVDELSKKLSSQYGRGYSRRNIFNMITLYEVFPDFEIVQLATAQFTQLPSKEVFEQKLQEAIANARLRLTDNRKHKEKTHETKI